MCMKIIRGTVFGGIGFFLLGWLIFGILLMDFTSANTNQCASKPMVEMVWWAIILSNLLSALLLTLFLKWSGAKTLFDGLKTGELFGIIYSSAIDLGWWSMMNWFNNFWALLADVAANTVMWGLVAMIIVLLWGKEKTA